METFTLFVIMAVIVEGLVEYVKTIVEMKDRKAVVIQLSALLAAVALCVLCGADVFTKLGMTFAVPYVGCVLTGIFASRGSNYVSDLIGKLNSLTKHSASEQISEVNKEDIVETVDEVTDDSNEEN